jgi:hypothetical protein
MLLKAALKIGNILILLSAALMASILYKYGLSVYIVAGGFVVYLALVLGTLGSKKFKAECMQDAKLKDIRVLSHECDDTYRQICNKIGRNLKSRAARIMKQKNELLEYFRKLSDDPIRHRIIEQAMKLVIAYFNLIYNYSVRMDELSPENMDQLASRINYNNRKLGALKSYEAVLELTKTVEMDEQLFKNMKEDRQDLEQLNVKLDYIESTIIGFKHRILSTNISDPEADEIENVINEASALDNVLNERDRNRTSL